jgi:hypothetical protein
MRKQVYDLSADDLLRFPVWEFALDEEGKEGQDEATVRPFPLEDMLDPATGIFVVSATFELNDRSQMKGYLTPPSRSDKGLGMIQPVIVSNRGQVGFWCGILKPSSDKIDNSYRRLGKSSSVDVFPMRFASDVPLLGGPVRGELSGFFFIEDINTKIVRVVS